MCDHLTQHNATPPTATPTTMPSIYHHALRSYIATEFAGIFRGTHAAQYAVHLMFRGDKVLRG